MKKLLSIALLGGTLMLSGCGDDRDEFVLTGNAPILAAPVAVNDAYAVNANTTLAVPVANSELTNGTVNGAPLAFSATTTNGGTITGLADGSFSYTPALDFFGTDTFTYTLANSGGSSSATVTGTVTAVNAFIVDSATGSDTTGSFTNGRPFATLQAALTAAPAGSDVVVRPGTYTGAVTLENGDRLLGSGSGLAANPQGTVRPALAGPVVLADGNTLDFLRIANAPTNAIDCIGQNGGTITNCEIDTVAGGDSAIFGTDVSGSWLVTNNIIKNAGGAGVVFTTSGSSSAVIRVNNNSITNNGTNAIGFITSDSSDLRAQIKGNTMTDNQTGFTFEVIAGGASTSIYDIEDNTNDDTYDLGSNAGFTGTFEVEEWDDLIARNNNSGTKTTALGSNPPVSVPDGSAGF